MDRRPTVTLSPRGRLALLAVAGIAFLAFVMGATSGASADSASGPVAYLKHLPPPQPTLASQQAKAFATVKTYTDYISKGTTAKNEVALTFDDGPSVYTPRMLKILRDSHTPATFFTVGEEYTTFGRSAQAAALAGYPIANHTRTHPNLPGLDLAGQASQINDTTATMVKAGIPAPGLFRPPYGAYDANTVALMKQKKMIMVLWTIDSEDWMMPGVDTIVQNVLGQISAGDIVLMHDGGGNREQSLAALPRILAGLKQKGLKPVTVAQMLLDDPPPRNQPPPPNASNG